MRPARRPLTALASLVADRGSDFERIKRQVEAMHRRMVNVEQQADAMVLEIDDLKRRVADLERA